MWVQTGRLANPPTASEKPAKSPRPRGKKTPARRARLLRVALLRFAHNRVGRDDRGDERLEEELGRRDVLEQHLHGVVERARAGGDCQLRDGAGRAVKTTPHTSEDYEAMKALGLNSVRVPVKAEDVSSLAKIDLRTILAVYGDADVDLSDAALVECDASATKVRAAAQARGG